MRTLFSYLALTLFAALPLTATPAHEGWVADFDEAAKIAREQKKDLLVDFTGSDWCGWCIRLNQEVFDHEEFLKPAREKYVLVALDFPRGEEAKAAVPNPERNQELLEKHGVGGFPTILLMTVDGEAYAQTGYREGGPAAYIEHLDQLRTEGLAALKKVAELVESLDAAEGDAKAKLYEEALEQLAAMTEGSPALAKLATAVKTTFVFDANDARGLKSRAVEALLKAGQGDEEVYVLARGMDPKNEKGLLEKVVLAQVNAVDSEEAVKAACTAIAELDGLGPIRDEETALALYVSAADWNSRFTGDADAAKKFAGKAKTLAGDNERLIEFLDGILDS